MLGEKSIFNKDRFLEGYESLTIVCRKADDVRKSVDILQQMYNITCFTLPTIEMVNNCDDNDVNDDKPTTIYYNEVTKKVEVVIFNEEYDVYDEYDNDYYFEDINFGIKEINVDSTDLLNFLSA